MSRILLTGGTGFLGAALAAHWCVGGHDVHLLVRSGSSLHRLLPVRHAITLHVMQDADDAQRLAEHVGPDVIVHTACCYGRAGEAPRAVFAANYALGVALLQSLETAGTPAAFINTGSVLEPNVSLYALSKHQFSAWGAQVAALARHPLTFVDVRLQHMFGPGDDGSKFTTHVLRSCAANVPALALTAGEQQRDFVFIDDVVGAYDRILAALPTLARFETIDVGSGEAPSIRTFVETARDVTGSHTRLDFGAVPYRVNEAMRCVADTTRLRALGWQPAFDLRSGLETTVSREKVRER